MPDVTRCMTIRDDSPSPEQTVKKGKKSREEVVRKRTLQL